MRKGNTTWAIYRDLYLGPVRYMVILEHKQQGGAFRSGRKIKSECKTIGKKVAKQARSGNGHRVSQKRQIIMFPSSRPEQFFEESQLSRTLRRNKGAIQEPDCKPPTIKAELFESLTVI